MNRKIVLTGALLIVIGIILGAFGAHALKEHLEPEQLTSYETGVRYQIYHGLALFMLGLASDKLSFNLVWVQRLLFSGIILFSGSIYMLSIQEILNVSLRFLGPITPLGGLLLIIGWLVLILNIIRDKNRIKV